MSVEEEIQGAPAPEPLPVVRCVTEPFNDQDAEHLRQWRAAGSPVSGWAPTFYEDLAEDGEAYVRRPYPVPTPVSAFEVAVRESKVILAAREEQAKGDITELKSRVAVTLVATGARMVDDTLITADNVNAEGSRFVVYHATLISAYKDAGGNPEAGQALYNSIASKPSKAAFPWLSDPVLAIFAATLLVESPAP